MHYAFGVFGTQPFWHLNSVKKGPLLYFWAIIFFFSPYPTHPPQYETSQTLFIPSRETPQHYYKIHNEDLRLHTQFYFWHVKCASNARHARKHPTECINIFNSYILSPS